MLEHINCPTTMHKNIVEWCLKYGKQVMNNFNDDEDDNLAYDPVVFNLISRIKLVEKRGGDTHSVEVFEIDRYLEQVVEKVLGSLEYSKILALRSKLSNECFRQTLSDLYPEYLIALLYPQDIESTPQWFED
jgi:hypothetical protein